jgi:hypothetical protein
MDGWMDGASVYSVLSVLNVLSVLSKDARKEGRNPLLHRKSVPKPVPTIVLGRFLVHSYVVQNPRANRVETEAACLSRETKHQMLLGNPKTLALWQRLFAVLTVRCMIQYSYRMRRNQSSIFARHGISG